MSQKQHATDMEVAAFLAAVFPDAPHLAMAAFDEQHTLRTATATITGLREQIATLTEALERAKTFNVRKFISEWSWESSHGPTLFHGEYHEKKQALEKFSQALVGAVLAAVRRERPPHKP